MLNTNELEAYVRNELNNSMYKEELIKDLEESYIFSNNFIPNRFGALSFIYSSDLGYHRYGIGDRGEVHKDEKIYDLVSICFFIFWDISFRLSTPPLFSVSNFSGDWRRWSFKRRLDILSSIDETYAIIGQQKIDDMLRDNPYRDALDVD